MTDRNPGGPLILMAAMGVELGPFRRQLYEPKRHDVGLAGLLWGTQVLLIRTGMGEEADFFCEKLGPLEARGVLALGIAGALDDTLRPGDVVIATEVMRRTQDAIHTDQGMAAGLVDAARAVAVPIRSGRLYTAEQFVDDEAVRHHLRQETGALTVDMETYAMARYAKKQGLPLAALRAVSDGADAKALATAAFYLPKVIGQYEKIIQHWLTVQNPFSS